MNENPVGWFEIYVQDLERARKFYETVFATELQKLDAPFPGIELWAFPMAQDSYGYPSCISALPLSHNECQSFKGHHQ